jgi:hypothetical protein
MMKNKFRGSSLDDFLKEEGVYDAFKAKGGEAIIPACLECNKKTAIRQCWPYDFYSGQE